MKRLESPIRIFLFKFVRINRSSCKSDCFSWSAAIGFLRVWLYGNIKFQNFLTKSTSCIWKSGRLPSYLSYYKFFSRCPARSSIALRNPLYLRLGGCHTPPHPPTIFAPVFSCQVKGGIDMNDRPKHLWAARELKTLERRSHGLTKIEGAWDKPCPRLDNRLPNSDKKHVNFSVKLKPDNFYVA